MPDYNRHSKVSQGCVTFFCCRLLLWHSPLLEMTNSQSNLRKQELNRNQTKLIFFAHLLVHNIMQSSLHILTALAFIHSPFRLRHRTLTATIATTLYILCHHIHLLFFPSLMAARGTGPRVKIAAKGPSWVPGAWHPVPAILRSVPSGRDAPSKPRPTQGNSWHNPHINEYHYTNCTITSTAAYII